MFARRPLLCLLLPRCFVRTTLRRLGSTTTNPRPRARVAVGQMTSTPDVEANVATVSTLVARAAGGGASLLSLPEAFHFLGGDPLDVADDLDGTVMERYSALARHHNVWLSLGGFHERSKTPGKVYNTHVLLDNKGQRVGTYRKLHLFDVDLPNGPRLLESKNTDAGNAIVCVDSPVGRLGLTTCYDIRFPELYTALTRQEAHVILIPSAFTSTTGKDHWEILLRARAIETQCYVAAAAQIGKHSAKRSSFGHAMIVDPWGCIVAQCSDVSPSVAVAEIDLDYLHSVRLQIPVRDHRRPDVYGCP